VLLTQYEAFDKLPAGTVDTLLKPENLDQLKRILTYRVVAGKMTSKDIAKAIKAGGKGGADHGRGRKIDRNDGWRQAGSD
jgi:uncharacterized surface protein with fasciclin (FAS1) repeats